MYDPGTIFRRVVACSIVGSAIFAALFLSLDRFWTEILIRAITLTPYRQSGNWVAVVVAIALVLIRQVLRWRRAKWKLKAMRAAWKAHLRDTMLSVFIVGSGLFFYSIFLEIRKINVDAKEVSQPSRPHWPSPPRLAEVKSAQHPAIPYAIQLESAAFSQRPKSETEATRFWVAYIGDNGKTISPARMVAYLRITNLQKHPAMIIRYLVMVNKTKMIKISGPPAEALYDGHGDIHRVCWIDDSVLLDKKLDKLNLQPGIPVQGIALFDYPKESRPEFLSESDLAGTKITITIVDAEGHSFTSEPLEPKPDPLNESVQARIISFNRGLRDLSSFKIKDFSISRGFVSPPW